MIGSLSEISDLPVIYRSAAQSIAAASRGTILPFRINNLGTLGGLKEGLSEMGMRSVVIETMHAARLSDMELSAILRDALHDDAILIVSGLMDESRCTDSRRLASYVRHAFAGQGGKAITISYS